MPAHPKSVTYKNFKGLSNVVAPEDTDPAYLKKSLNIDIDRTGSISKRLGYVKKDTANYSSIWASANGLGCYAIRNGDLIKLNDDYSYQTLKPSIGDISLSFEEIDDTIYISSPSFKGTIKYGILSSWGISKNTLIPTLSVVTGILPIGTYQVAFTYVRNDGLESGTSSASIITVPNGSGISLQIPTSSDSSLAYARIYCSTTDGNTLFYSGIATLGSTYVISDTSGLINPLRTFNLDEPPLGSIIRYYKGRMFVADNNILWYSEPFQYNFFKLDSSYFEFPEDIVEVMVVDDGIWIGSDKLYYLSGEEPSKYSLNIKENVKIVPGTSSKVPSSYLSLPGGDPGGFRWLVTADLGIFMLVNQGLSANLTSANVELDNATSGTSIFLQHSGINRYLSVLKTTPDPNKAVVGDLVETSIVRNGIIIT